MRLKLKFPITGFLVQSFGGNATPTYHNNGLIGHTGIDVQSSYNDIIKNSVVECNKQTIYSILNKDNPDLMKYRAVFQIVEADNGVFEISYGHCNNITCQLGQSNTDEVLATEGNTGEVYSGTHEVTNLEKLGGSTAGFHVHFQVRRLRKVQNTTIHSLTTDGIHDYVEDGWHFDVPNYDNGYNGCIDGMQFIGQQNNYMFNRNLGVGNIGYDVYQLQKRLVRLGFASFIPTGFFGYQTQEAVKLYQEANGIEQLGICGPKTRASLAL